MREIQLGTAEVEAVLEVETELAVRYRSVADPEFLDEADTWAQELPRGLRRHLNEFRLRESAGLCLISGHPIDDARIGDTPPHWRRPPHEVSPALREEFFFFLCASLLGDPIGWSTQQGRRIMHDVLPIPGHEDMQINSASAATIFWHTEDAFHPYRAEYVGLMCLRNPDAVETTYATLDGVKLKPDTLAVLFEPRFMIRPDESHRQPDLDDDQVDDPAQRMSIDRIRQMYEAPERVAVLFGHPDDPYLRLDPFFMDREGEDEESAAALDELIAALTDNLTGVALRPGQVLFVDNFKAVHGRSPFTARYDGRDRWLKRLNVARDLRKSRAARATAASRILY